MSISMLNSLYEKYLDDIQDNYLKNPKHSSLSDESNNALCQLKESLNNEQKKLLDKYIDVYGRLETLYEQECFGFGFALANTLYKDSLKKLDNLNNELEED